MGCNPWRAGLVPQCSGGPVRQLNPLPGPKISQEVLQPRACAIENGCTKEAFAPLGFHRVIFDHDGIFDYEIFALADALWVPLGDMLKPAAGDKRKR